MMNLLPVIDIVKRYTPALGALIGAANPLAGVVFTTIAHAIGADPTSIPDVTAKLSTDPDIEAKLSAIDLQFQQVKSTNYLAELSDTQDARARDEQLIAEAGKPNAGFAVTLIALIPHLLTLLTGGAIIGIGLLRMYMTSNAANDTLLAMIVTQLLYIFTKQCNFYFGTSHQTKGK